MNRLLGSLLVLLGCSSGDDAQPRNQPPAGWELVWADEFDGPVVDLRNWTPEVMPDPHNEELQYYTDRIDTAPSANAWLEDGALIIEARREDFAHRKYTSARLITKGKREFRYGRFEARIKQPGEVGMWPACWLLGGNIDRVGWPRCGEIDVMEGKGRLPDWTSGALHRGPDPARNRITAAEYRLPSGSFHDQWHVFAIEWLPGRIQWYVDGIAFQAVGNTAGEDLAFDKPHLPPENLTPQRLYVDYVRVYRSVAEPPRC